MSKLAPLAFAGVGLLSLATPALAQAANSPADTGASAATDIIVTARRRAEAVQDVPLVVDVVTSQNLAKLNIRDFSDIQTLVPGLQLVPDPAGVAPVATLRGVAFSSDSSGSNSTVQFYLNDAVISAGFLLQSMFDVDQIEVLRGPQGTLRGIAAPSGSITVTTRRPDLDSIGGYVTSTVNAIGGVNINGAVNVPIIKDVLAVRLAGIINDDDGTRVHSINDPSANPFDHGRGERITIRFDPTNSIDIIGSYQHFLNNSQYFNQIESANLALGTPVVGTLITPFQRESVEDAPLTSRTNYNIWNIQAQWQFAGQKLNYVGAWENQSILNQARGDQGNAYGNNYPGNASADPLTSPNLQNYGQYGLTTESQYSHELRLSSDEQILGIFDYTIGGLINRLYTPTNLLIETPIFLGPPSPASFYEVAQTPFPLKNRSLERSVFGNLTAHLGDKTEISGGLRYIHFNFISSLLSAPADFHPLVYSFSIKHRFSDNIMAYASTGSSWRSSVGTNGIILATGGNVAYSDPALAAILGVIPEKSKSYEAGFKTDWFDKRMQLNLTYYHQDFHNFIFTSPQVVYLNDLGGTPANYAPSLSQSGLGVGVPVKVNGVEGELAFQPNEHFNLGISMSYSVGRITNGLVPCTGTSLPTPPQQINFCTVNQRSNLTAPFNASVQTGYTRHAFGQVDGFIRGQLTYAGYSLNDPTNPYDNIKAYGLVNLFAGLRNHDGAWEFSAYVKNIFNTQRVLTRIAVPYAATYENALTREGGELASNYRGITTTQPREFGINLRYAFGSR